MLRRLCASALIVAAIAALHLSGVIRPAQHWLEEARFDADSRAASGAIAFVEIDPRSLEAIGVWPWPRSLHARAVDRLLAAGAAEIAFDIDFSAASREAEDLAFEQALERAGGIVALPTFRQAWSVAADHSAEHVNEPLERFARHSWAATVNVYADADGRIRMLPVGDTIDGEFRPSIAALYGGLPDGAGTAAFIVDFSIDPATVPRLSFIDVVNGRIAAGAVAGKKVLIGAAAAELRDHFAVPAHGIMSGPMLQIIGAESILQGRALSRTSTLTTLVLLAVVLALSLVLRRSGSWKAHLAAMAALALCAEAFAFLIQAHAPMILETAPLNLAVLLLCAAAMIGEVDLRGLLLRVAHAETRAARDMLDQVVADNFDGIVVIGESGAILSANGAAARILRLPGGFPDREERFEVMLPDVLTAHVRSAFAAFAAGQATIAEPVELECSLGGAPVVLECLATPSRIGTEDAPRGHASTGQTVVCLTFRDVTERNRERAQIDYLAHYDGLTGLANRNRLHAVLERELRSARGPGRGVAVISFDLDRFKGVNDTLGHHYGDLLLKQIAVRAELICGSGGIVARFGGDEFVLVPRDAGARDDACRVAADLLESLHVAYNLEGHRVIIGASAGVAMARGETVSAGELIRRADAALHKAKAEGGNRHCVYEPEFGERLHVRRQIELDLWKAFEQDEFEVHFQPQVDLASGRLNGAEALLRWKCPQRGYVSPAEFVPVAEDIGLIADLGAWTLAAACAEASKWPQPLKFAVNVSAHQFRVGDLMATVDDAMAKYGIDGARLELEITESVLAEENPVTASILAAVRERGIAIALDDFGTGYSSLSYVRRFPISKIKIDQSFVSGLPHDEGALAIVRAVTALASSLGLSTTAEGIETREQARTIRLTGCDQGQGYLFSRPLPAAEFRSFAERSSDGLPLVA